MTRLFAKISAVMGAVERVPKSGRNNFHKYDYATEADIVAAIRGAMTEQNLGLVAETIAVERIETGHEKAGPITRAHMRYWLVCGDTGAMFSAEWFGEGQDAGDKGLYKAYTGALKYFLMKTFLIATGDEPEQDAPARQPTPAPSIPRRQEQPVDPERAALIHELGALRAELHELSPASLGELAAKDAIRGMNHEQLRHEIGRARQVLGREQGPPEPAEAPLFDEAA